MLLSELIKRIDCLGVENFSECEINGVTQTSGEVTEGSVFVCVKGNECDGGSFAPEALSRGASAFVFENGAEIIAEKTSIFSENPRKTLAEISSVLYGESLGKMKIIGVTGTKGKTTTAKIISECIASLGLPCISIGTFGVEYYGALRERVETKNTTPDAPFIYKTLADALENGIKVAVIEVSSQALASYRVYKIPFTVSVFTNFSPDHIGIGEHRTEEEYLRAKRSLFTDFGAKICIVNADDEKSDYISHGVEHTIRIGENETEYKLRIADTSETATRFSLCGEEFLLSLGGSFNAKNAALAIVTVSLLFGRELSQFRTVLGNFSIRGRYELYSVEGKTVIIDFAHNAESFKAVCLGAREHTAGRLIAVFGSVGERSHRRREELAGAAEAYADLAVITSDNPGREDPERICLDIYSNFKDKRRAKIIPDRERAIRFAVEFADSADTVLLLGKGHEEYQRVGDKKVPFSEREILAAMGAERYKR